MDSTIKKKHRRARLALMAKLGCVCLALGALFVACSRPPDLAARRVSERAPDIATEQSAPKEELPPVGHAEDSPPVKAGAPELPVESSEPPQPGTRAPASVRTVKAAGAQQQQQQQQADAPPPMEVEAPRPSPKSAPPPPSAMPESLPTTAAPPTPVSHGAVWLHFATDRQWTGSETQPKWFAKEREQVGGELSYGMCQVTIPVEAHERNRVEKPLSIFGFTLPEDPQKHVIVERPLLTPRDKFFTRLTTEVQRRPESEREVLIFIHGFNNTFDDAASRLAVLVYDMDFNGVPLLYSWPSAGSGTPFGYKHDEVTVSETVDAFTDFLREAVQHARAGGARRCNIVAHSMGNRALIEALTRLAAANAGPALFDEVVMAAPDVAERGFKERVWQKIRGSGTRLTLYASARDKALALSQTFSSFPRIGQAGPALLLLDKLDTIDASEVDFSDLGLNHTYFGGRTVLQDMRQLLHNGWEPPRRKLLPQERAKLKFWTFPP